MPQVHFAWPKFRVIGLHKLQYIDIQNNNFPNFATTFYNDFPSLKELHTAGNKLSADGVIHEEMFANNPWLEVVNMSNTQIQRTEKNVFYHLV